MKILKEDLSRLIHGDDNTHPDWKILDDSVIDEWRWGTVSLIALKHLGTGEIYGYTYREQKGDQYYNSVDEELNEGEEVELYPVVSEMVIRYRIATEAS